MFGIGFSEMLVMGVILVIVVGPNRIPDVFKAIVRGYREFRRATRELRASAGIHELLEDADLRAMKKRLHIPPAKESAPPRGSALSYVERPQANPPEGVDIGNTRAGDARPSLEEAERVRAANVAGAGDAGPEELGRACAGEIVAGERNDSPDQIHTTRPAVARDDENVEDADGVVAAKAVGAGE